MNLDMESGDESKENTDITTAVATTPAPPPSNSRDSAVTTCVVFLDVDGVLNSNWHGSGTTAPTTVDDGDIDLDLVSNLSLLIQRISTECQLGAQLVLSTTWRHNPFQRQTLIAALKMVGLAKSLHPTSPLTPTIAQSSGSAEARNAEICAWLRQNGATEALFLVLDDMNVLFSSMGKPITSLIDDVHFIHTVTGTAQQETNDGGNSAPSIGLSRDLIEIALSKLKNQQIDATRVIPVGFSEAEWRELQQSTLPLSLLKFRRCPKWILQQVSNQSIDRHSVFVIVAVISVLLISFPNLTCLSLPSVHA